MGIKKGQNCWQQSTNRNDAVSDTTYVVVYCGVLYSKLVQEKINDYVNFMPKLLSLCHQFDVHQELSPKKEDHHIILGSEQKGGIF